MNTIQCSHQTQIIGICLSDECQFQSFAYCKSCSTTHQSSKCKTITISQIQLSIKNLTVQGAKPKGRALQEIIFQCFCSKKKIIMNLLDGICKSIVNQVQYPFLSFHQRLQTFKILKKKEYKKLAKIDFQQIVSFTNSISLEELPRLQSQCYLMFVNEAINITERIQHLSQDLVQIGQGFNLKIIKDNKSFEKVNTIIGEIRKIYKNKNIKHKTETVKSEQKKRINILSNQNSSKKTKNCEYKYCETQITSKGQQDFLSRKLEQFSSFQDQINTNKSQKKHRTQQASPNDMDKSKKKSSLNENLVINQEKKIQVNNKLEATGCFPKIKNFDIQNIKNVLTKKIIVEVSQKSQFLRNLAKKYKQKQPSIKIPINQITKTSHQLRDLSLNQQKSLQYYLRSFNLPIEDAVQYLQQSLKHSQSNISSAQYLSFIYLQTNQPKKCLQLCNLWLEKLKQLDLINDFGVNIIINKSGALNLLGRYSESIMTLQEHLWLVRKAEAAYKNMGDSYLQLNKYTQAIENYEQSIELNKLFDESYYNLSVCYYMIGDWKKSKQNSQMALNIDKNNTVYQSFYQVISQIYKKNNKSVV